MSGLQEDAKLLHLPWSSKILSYKVLGPVVDGWRKTCDESQRRDVAPRRPLTPPSAARGAAGGSCALAERSMAKRLSSGRTRASRACPSAFTWLGLWNYLPAEGESFLCWSALWCLQPVGAHGSELPNAMDGMRSRWMMVNMLLSRSSSSLSS